MVELVDHTYDGRRVVPGRVQYYTSVDRNALSPLLQCVAALLYNLSIQLCSS